MQPVPWPDAAMQAVPRHWVHGAEQARPVACRARRARTLNASSVSRRWRPRLREAQHPRACCWVVRPRGRWLGRWARRACACRRIRQHATPGFQLAPWTVCGAGHAVGALVMVGAVRVHNDVTHAHRGAHLRPADVRAERSRKPGQQRHGQQRKSCQPGGGVQTATCLADHGASVVDPRAEVTVRRWFWRRRLSSALTPADPSVSTWRWMLPGCSWRALLPCLSRDHGGCMSHPRLDLTVW